jgi:glycerol-3-phosphate cytidylyltransferase
MKSGVIFGCWDLYHVGHLHALQEAAKHCDYLYIGVFSDRVIKEYKGHAPIVPQKERLELMNSIDLSAYKCRALSFLVDYREPIVWRIYDYLFVSEQLRNKELAMIDKNSDGQVIYVPYTKGISTSHIRSKILDGGCVCKCK